MVVLIEVLKLLFDDAKVDHLKKLIRTSNLQHILDNTVVDLFNLVDHVLDIFLPFKVDGPISLKSLNVFELLLHEHSPHFAKNLHRLLVNHYWLKEDIHSIVVDLYAYLK